MTESAISHFPYFAVAFGKNGRTKRRKPYVPIFSMTPARMIEPPVGASTWASGSQVCSGKSGTLMAKARAKAKKRSASVVPLR